MDYLTNAIDSEKKPKALFLCFDFETWSEARSWSYVSSYLLYHESLKGFDCELQILLHRNSAAKNEQIVYRITEGRNFDFVLVWLPHAKISKKLKRRLQESSKVLSFLLVESLCYTDDEIAELPHLRHRWNEVTALLKSDANVISLCPQSYRRLLDAGYNAKFTLGFLPTELQRYHAACGEKSGYAFAASLYNKARREASKFVSDLAKTLTLEKIKISDPIELTDRFDSLVEQLRVSDIRETLARAALCSQIANVRKDIWLAYLNTLARANFLITFPSYFKGAPGRVIEALTCNVPVIFFESNIDTEDIRKLSLLQRVHFAERDSLRFCVEGFLESSPEIMREEKARLENLFSETAKFLIEVYSTNPPLRSRSTVRQLIDFIRGK